MAKKKVKQLPKKRTNTTAPTSSCLDIPKMLRNRIYTNHIFVSYASSGTGAAKSWKVSSKRCQSTGKTTSPVPQLYGTMDCETQGCIGGYQIPIWDTNVPHKHLALSFLHRDNFILLVVTGCSHPAYVYYKRTSPWETPISRSWLRHNPEEHKWVGQNCTLIDPNCSNQQHMQFYSVVWLKGKFYALSLQGTLVVIEEVDSCMVITGICKRRIIPSVFSRNFREFLIESNGQISLIFLVSKKSASLIDNVEIFSLQMLPKLAWEKVEHLGDRVVFVGDNIRCIVNAIELGCKGNCVCFTNVGATGWWVFDMARGDISPASWCSDSSSTIFNYLTCSS